MLNERDPGEGYTNSIPKRELAKYVLSLVTGRDENKMLVLAARASVAGGVSAATAIMGFATGRLEIAALGGALTFISGYIGLGAVNASR